MTILITGATGFIGSHLSEKLLKKKEKIRILARKTSRIDWLKKQGVEICYGSLEDINSLTKATKNIKIVYHLAAMLGSPEITYKKLYEVNVKGTENLVKACEKNKVKRFILISSVAAIGPAKHMADETTKCNPVTDYDKTKYLAELAVKKSDLDWTIIRPTMVYGPREIRNKAKMFRLVQKKVFVIIGNGKNLMSLVYVDNLIKGIILAGESIRAAKHTYILSDKHPYTMNEFIKTIATHENVRMPLHIPVWFAYLGTFCFRLLRFTGVPQLLSVDRIKNMTMNHSFSISKAIKELNYNPKINLDEGVKRTVQWYKEKGILK